ncbi:isoaspartyl peptidase/L-asparaginase family protein [Dictyobacter aurantiacus]|uniref:Peptidase T n=1 Tax=Dictyobacter aurantiacus TaxID=1936993 RepID=A0A401ZD95_9CHLR|nr:isoaspartyl peptidase/L-asparaginase [Dictyobacter aurantiacus]GCE04822.1 peptidase T [Dictyobacter aurantiacus]
MPIALIVHGGAGDIKEERFEGARTGCKEAAQVGWRVLQAGGSALDAVEAAVRALEDNPDFNAGRGSCLNKEGKIEMDAGIMDGHSLNVGAIAGVELIQNPITLARRVMESEHTFLIGAGAQFFAREQGINPCHYEDLLTERQYQAWKHHTHSSLTYEAKTDTQQEKKQKHGTVGAVAIDSAGRLAAATSTGGIANKYPGRVGDSPLVGCGFYADEHAAISCTGYGEDFTRLMIAQRAASYAAQGMDARQAGEAAINFLSKHAEGDGGLIIVDHHGNVSKAKNSKCIAHAYINEQMTEPIADIF